MERRLTSPANAASVALIQQGQVLLIQRAYAPYQHLWTLPGGRREPGETIEHCAAREIREELGLTIAELRLVLVQALGTDQQYVLAVFATQQFSGTITPSDEIADFCWIRPDQIGDRVTTDRFDLVLAQAFALFAGR